jgi:hypothetical protein
VIAPPPAIIYACYENGSLVVRSAQCAIITPPSVATPDVIIHAAPPRTGSAGLAARNRGFDFFHWVRSLWK